MAKQKNQILRVAAIHDLCGYGKCSLGIVTPMLSTMGVEVCPIPTGIFSMHTEIEGWERLDTTPFLPKYIGSWSKKGIKFDAIYSGFISSTEQADLIAKLYTENLYALRILDPVMGDKGQLYETYNECLCSSVKKLVEGADIITPNLTEACILLDIDYVEQPDEDQITDMITKLKDMGANGVVLKSVKIVNDEIFNYIIDDMGNITKVKNKYIPYRLPGTGDLYCSVLCGAYLNGYDLNKSAEIAGDFVYNSIKVSLNQPGFEERGVSFEPLCGGLSKLIKK